MGAFCEAPFPFLLESVSVSKCRGHPQPMTSFREIENGPASMVLPHRPSWTAWTIDLWGSSGLSLIKLRRQNRQTDDLFSFDRVCHAVAGVCCLCFRRGIELTPTCVMSDEKEQIARPTYLGSNQHVDVSVISGMATEADNEYLRLNI